MSSHHGLTWRQRASRALRVQALLMVGALLASGCERDATLRAQPERVGSVTLGTLHHGPKRAQAPPSDSAEGAQGGMTAGDADGAHDDAADADSASLWRAPLQGGGQLELTTLVWAIGDVELHACETPAPQRASLHDWLIPSAHAHVPDSATRLGTPFVEDLLGPQGKARIMGELAPPHGRYCALEVIFAPADDDIINMTEADTEALIGNTYLIAGRVRASSDAPWQQLNASGPWRHAQRVALPELTLSAYSEGEFLLIDKTLSDSLVSHLDAATLAAEGGAVALMQALASALTLYTPGDGAPP